MVTLTPPHCINILKVDLPPICYWLQTFFTALSVDGRIYQWDWSCHCSNDCSILWSKWGTIVVHHNQTQGPCYRKILMNCQKDINKLSKSRQRPNKVLTRLLTKFEIAEHQSLIFWSCFKYLISSLTKVLLAVSLENIQTHIFHPQD